MQFLFNLSETKLNFNTYQHSVLIYVLIVDLQHNK